MLSKLRVNKDVLVVLVNLGSLFVSMKSCSQSQEAAAVAEASNR
jgi:hypothetical protein